MATYLARLRPTRLEMLSAGPTAAEAAAVEQHFAYLQELIAAGTLILAGRTLNTDAESFGILIFNAESPAAAQAVVEHDPAIRLGVMAVAVFPYRIALLAAANHTPA